MLESVLPPVFSKYGVYGQRVSHGGIAQVEIPIAKALGLVRVSGEVDLKGQLIILAAA